ncbi:MAG: helix-turn-helix domain-containing protein [Legionellales bacterium]|nr:helix-turn-helix domain-containing protein [Legionellales bacterium]
MSNLNDTIHDIARGLYKADLIDKKTLRDLTDDERPELITYTGEDIQRLREREKLSQAVFAMYLNISPEMVRSMEHGQRRPQGAILKLLNIVDKHGISMLS